MMKTNFIVKTITAGNEVLGIQIMINRKQTFISWEILRLLIEIKEHDYLFEDVLEELFRIKQRYD